MTKLAALVLVAGALTAGGTAPVATSRPAVFGTLQQGSRLTANPGSSQPSARVPAAIPSPTGHESVASAGGGTGVAVLLKGLRFHHIR